MDKDSKTKDSEPKQNERRGRRGAIILAVCMAMMTIGCGDELSRANPSLLSQGPIIGTPYASDGLDKVPDDAPVIPCVTDTDCKQAGPWRRCADHVCDFDLTGRTLRFERIDVHQPTVASAPMTALFNGAIETGDLNLLVQLGHDMSWVIQGEPSGSVSGAPTFGHGTHFGSYCGQNTVSCDGHICETSFRPETETGGILIRVKTQNEAGACAYQTVELVDVVVDVVVQLGPIPGHESDTEPSAIITLDGAISMRSAEGIIMDDGSRLSEMMATDETEGTVGLGPRMTLMAMGRQAVFDSDPSAGFDGQPTEQAPSLTMPDNDCP
mgnify:CR=1 FL=1